MVNSSSSLAISCATSPKTPGFSKSYKKFQPLLSQIQSVYIDGICGTIGAIMSKVAAILGFSLVVVLVSSGQEHEAGSLRAVKFDQFGQLGNCDMGARLDNRKRSIVFKQFNVEPSRFKLIFGGQQKETRVQYWILPNNAPPPVADAATEKALASMGIWIAPEGAPLPNPNEDEEESADPKDDPGIKPWHEQ
jgi:hypothetical protein